MQLDSFSIRELQAADLPLIRKLGMRVFPLPLGLLMAATVAPPGLVAVDHNGAVIGALTLRTARLAQRRWGILDWAVVDPTHQGKGIGTALGDHALSLLRQQGCDEIITTGIDGYNSASWNAAYARGLRYWPPHQQIRTVGWHWPRLLVIIPHVGVSTFILRRSLKQHDQPEVDPAATPGSRAWMVAAAWSSVLLTLSRVREVVWSSITPADLLAPLDPATMLAGAALMVGYMAIRMVAHGLAARALSLPLGYRIWESGIMMATLLAIAFSAFIPAFAGSYYVRDPRFNYLRNRAAMGKIMLAGITTSLLLYLLFSVWVRHSAPATPIVATLGQYVGLALGITDTLAFFAPFQSLPGGHVWLWRRWIWLVILGCFLSIWLLIPQIL